MLPLSGHANHVLPQRCGVIDPGGYSFASVAAKRLASVILPKIPGRAV